MSFSLSLGVAEVAAVNETVGDSLKYDGSFFMNGCDGRRRCLRFFCGIVYFFCYCELSWGKAWVNIYSRIKFQDIKGFC